MGTEIYVYENVRYYSKVYEDGQHSNVNYHVDVKRMFIKPPENNLWVVTEIMNEHNRPDLSRSICLFFAGIDEKTSNPLMYKDNPPVEIYPPDVRYNPKEHLLELTLEKALFKHKKVALHVDRYHGDNIPKNTVTVGYGWFYDKTRNRLNFVLEPNNVD